MNSKRVFFTQQRWPRIWVAVFVCGLFLSITNMKNAWADISQIPLYVAVEVAPNIVFVIDDSGSMQFETLPGNVALSPIRREGIWPTYGVFYMFPAADRIYCNDLPSRQCSDYWYSSSYRGYKKHNVPRFDSGDKWAAYFRSPHNNTIYYNHEVRYLPWLDKDGNPWPDAVPSAAFHNPADTDKGTRNLTDTNYGSACWIEPGAHDSERGFCTQESINFYPATYFEYDGSGEVYDPDNYTRVEIKPGSTYAGGEDRADCANPSACTYEEEIQNFANWYTYHRSRLLTSRAAIGRAFAEQGESIRVGFGTINAGGKTLDGVYSDGTMVQGVRDFSGTDREAFFDELYTRPFYLEGTPLRRGLDDVGQYYCRDDAQGPWSTTPGSSDGECLACRNSYTILMTDGYWNYGDSYDARGSARRANVDGSDGPSIPHPVTGSNYQYENEAPYQDNHDNTLADVAMYYWNHDLVSLENKVPISAVDEAYWQHMVTFTVGLVDSGNLDPANDLDALTEGTKTWSDPDIDGSSPYKIDDMWHAALNSRGDFFTATDPEAFSQQLSALLTSLIDRKNGSAAAIAANATRLSDTTLIYQAKYNSNDWSGELIAHHVNSDGSVGDVEWDTDEAGKIPAHDNRNIYAWNGSTGVEFIWNNLSTIQKEALQSGGTEQEGKDRLNWLRGDQSKEEDKTDGYLRTRERILGDIVNSDPLMVGVIDYQYDQLPSGVDGQNTYNTFLSNISSQSKTLFIGANDGMLHAFDASTGVEKFAYMPAGVFNSLADLTDPDYTHKFFVDGSPVVGHACIGDTSDSNGGWRAVLVGTLGAGGRTVFALDVTDPDNFDATKVLWEFTDPDLGYALGQPVVARLQNGQWAAIFGNGYESENGRAFLFVVNLADGTLIKKFDTGAGGGTSLNGLATPALLPDSQRTIEYAYAGDLLGNLWKFDLTHASNTNQWDVAFSQGGTKYPLFQALNSAGETQPITAPVEIGLYSDGNESRYMVLFGTGKYFETEDNVVGSNPSVQSFYGIWDNGSRVTETDRSTLVGQTILAEGVVETNNKGYRVVSENTVDWSSQRGWYLDLVSPDGAEGERVVNVPLLRYGRVIITTLIPLSNPCTAGGASWLMELDALTGSRLDYSALDIDGDGKIDSSDMVSFTINGEEKSVHASGSGSDDTVYQPPKPLDGPEDKEYKYIADSDGNIVVITEKASDSDLFGRRSWRQIK